MTFKKSKHVYTQIDNYGSLQRRQERVAGPSTEFGTRGEVSRALKDLQIREYDWFENPKIEVTSTIKVSMEEGWVVTTYAVPTLHGIHVFCP